MTSRVKAPRATTSPSKGSGAPRGDKTEHRIWWDEVDWDLITEGSPWLAAETHIDVTPTDFIRAAVRRLHAELAKKAAA